MATSIEAPFLILSKSLTEARDLACALRDRPPVDPRLVAAEVEKIAALLEGAIGGPTDPNKPSSP